MSNLNKGRFKRADEAQAVWNFFVQIYSTYDINGFKKGDLIAEHCFSSITKELHKARLIHGSIYDEHGRIEDNDVAQLAYNKCCEFGPCSFVPSLSIDFDELSINFDDVADEMLEAGKIRGTIFY